MKIRDLPINKLKIDMKIKKYIELLNIEDPIDQLKEIGYTKPLKVGEAKKLIGKKLTFEYTPREIKKFRINGRRFKLLFDIESLDVGDYALFKSILGDVNANQLNDKDEIIEIDQLEKYKKLFLKSPQILAIFTKELTFFRKKLPFKEKVELFSSLEVQKVINILFFYLKRTGRLTKNGMIYYMEMQKKMIKEIIE